MNRCSFREWLPILPRPIWPLAGQCSLGQNAVVGAMTLLLAMRGNIATRSMSGPPFALQRHHTTVWCRAIRPTVALWIRRFEAEHLAGLEDKSRAPKAPARKVWLPLMIEVYHLQKRHPDAGEFRIWSLLA